MTAVQIERTYTKPEILEMYMNLMSFGHGTWGIASASKKFFAAPVEELTIPQAALLAGMLQRPGALNPYRYPDRALRRRNLVLRRMRSENFITQLEYDNFVETDLGIVDIAIDPDLGIAPYFTEYLRKNLQKEYGMDLYKGGMTIYTSLDTRVQAAADSAMQGHLPSLQKVVNRNMRKPKEFARLVPPSHLAGKSLSQLMQNEAYVDSMIAAKCAVQAMLDDEVAKDPSLVYAVVAFGDELADRSPQKLVITD